MTNPTQRIVVLVPAYNEESSIAATLEAVLAQTRLPDLLVVVPNGCTDGTADVARSYESSRVVVMELPRLENKKSEALNRAWSEHGYDCDILVCLDADTELPPNAIEDWEKEFQDGKKTLLAGSSSKFTMQAPGLLSRLQKSEFATWTDTALYKGDTHVLAGTGCAISGEVLREVAARDDREGPWCYSSQVEDFELTYRIRELGYRCQVSPTVRAYTDSMKDVKSLWNQRMKWQVGTVEDLLDIGWNRLTHRDWMQQMSGVFSAFTKALWVYVIAANWMLSGGLNIMWVWWLFPVLFIALDIKRALRIPHRDWKDIVIAASFLPNEIFSWMRSAWFVRSWFDVLVSKVTHRRKDRWTAQYAAEGVI